MNRLMLALSLLALSLSSTAQAGFMPGIIHDTAPRPEQGWTQGVPERACERADTACTLHWSGQEERTAEPESFVWWTELEHLIGRFLP